MNESNREVVKQILTDVAQNFAFMFADDMEESLESSPPYVKAEMSFLGPYKGKIIMVAPELLCGDIMNNVLGIDESEIDLEIEPKDALCEFLNNLWKFANNNSGYRTYF
jgi:chemotaxis protein CheY-P-specific phosphatase CheC